LNPLPAPIRALLGLVIALFVSTAFAQSVRPTTDRLDAIVSYPLVIPILAEQERELRNGVITKLDDGRTLESTPFWVGLTPHRQTPGWTNSPGIWTATPYQTIAKIPLNKRPIGAWFINIPLPIDAVGQGLWIAGERYELNWLPDPQRTILEASLSTRDQSHDQTSSLESFWSLHLDDTALADPAARLAIDQYRQDPFQNWRAHLLTDGLDPHHPDPSADLTLDQLDLELSIDTPGADLLGAIAHQHRARWQIILGRIWLIDPDAALALKRQLIRTAQFNSRTLPIWPSNTTELARLAHDLLSPYIDDSTRALRANAWLEAQPRALAWVIDDQGQIEAGTDRFIPTLGVISLPQTLGMSLFRIDTPAGFDATDPELVTVPAQEATQISIATDPIHLSPNNPSLETKPIRIRTGRWNADRQMIASPTPARAPFVRIGPMVTDWTMNALLSNRPLESASPAIQSAALGILRRVATPSPDHQSVGWQLYLELGSPNPRSADESLTLWVGPYTNPFAVWTITPDGQVRFEQGNRPSVGIPRVQIRILDDRWVAMIDLPSGAFDAGLLQLGLERTDANGLHTAWPRRMIPGQSEPGRLAIEIDNFDQLADD